ncbi:MAG TPA: ribbon-helix-helix protein, CopG family [Roseiarcus sp.]|nr:ribbon-helix-helix protein, CopG family [Roseiarcus sp.]
MSKNVMITARVEDDLARRLKRLAIVQGRSKSWLVGRALESYIDSELAFVEAVEEGRREMRAGRTIPHAKVFADLKRRLGTHK